MNEYHPLRDARRNSRQVFQHHQDRGRMKIRCPPEWESDTVFNDENAPPTVDIPQKSNVGSPFPLPPDFVDAGTPSDSKSGGHPSPLVRLLEELQDIDRTPQRTPLRNLSLSYMNTQGTQVSPDHNFQTELSDVQLSCPRPPAIAASPPAPVPAPLLRFKKNPDSGEFQLVRRASETDVTQFAALLHTNIRHVKAKETGIPWQTPETSQTTELPASGDELASNTSSWGVCSQIECQRSVLEITKKSFGDSDMPTAKQTDHHRVRRIEKLSLTTDTTNQKKGYLLPSKKAESSSLCNSSTAGSIVEEFNAGSEEQIPQHTEAKAEIETNLDPRPYRPLSRASSASRDNPDRRIQTTVPNTFLSTSGVELETDSDVSTKDHQKNDHLACQYTKLSDNEAKGFLIGHDNELPSSILSPENANGLPSQRYGYAKRSPIAGVLSPPGRRRSQHPAFSPEQKHYYESDTNNNDVVSPPLRPILSPEEHDNLLIISPPEHVKRRPSYPFSESVDVSDSLNVSNIPNTSQPKGIEPDTPYKWAVKQKLRQEAECDKTPIRSILDSLELTTTIRKQRPSTWAEQQELMDTMLSSGEFSKICGVKSTKDCGSSPIRWKNSTIATQVSPTGKHSSTTQTSQWEFVNGDGCYGRIDQIAPPPVSSRSVSASSRVPSVDGPKGKIKSSRGLIQQAASKLRNPSATRKYRRSAKPERVADTEAASLGWSVKTTNSETKKVNSKRRKVTPITPPSLYDIRMAKLSKQVRTQSRGAQRK
eukprot:TRINITY_DN1373_c1_g1_i2.p1 TRINITY_DN1373_c1_g1~~TRINITY_DN1373_c1_g1_i2.p1  ORF type:complete len:763 (+),score=140.87 TRINITY_DN1373_c1_g1_i2:33-2321(+)